MKNPRVSICIPNLNTARFLAKRFESLLTQDFSDWEAFIYDGFSDDGSWDIICAYANRDLRIRAEQGPRDGPYPAWNECVRRTQGEFIYIATSDDTAAPNCLSKLVAALDKNPSCDIAHTRLRIIDTADADVALPRWPANTIFAHGLERLTSVEHLRLPPFMGLLHLSGRHAVTSITQVLIRRTLFKRIGGFSNRWGSSSDFNWMMRAGLTTGFVHVPDTWASWRIRPGQLTDVYGGPSLQRDKRVDSMIADALGAVDWPLASDLRVLRWMDQQNTLRRYYSELRAQSSPLARRMLQVRTAVAAPAILSRETIRRLRGLGKWPVKFGEDLRRILTVAGLDPVHVTSAPE